MERILYEIKKVIVGQDHFLERVLVASVRGGRHAAQTFEPADWSNPRVRLDTARTICESFSITRNNQNLTKIAKAIADAVG